MLDLTGVPECTRCGACCFSDNPEYLRVLGGDHERLGEDASRLTQFVGNRLYMKLLSGHCAALTCDAQTGQYLCSVYDRRPDVCHWLERGSGQCAAERHEKSERPLLMLRRASDES